MTGEKTYTIRRFCHGEGELYRSVRLETLRESPEAFSSSYETALGRSIESWADQADAAAEGGDRAIFIVQDGESVGLAALYRDPESSGQGELVQMWIAPSHRNGGVGEALLNYLFNWAANHSYAAVKAVVTDGNQRALRFYLNYGFAGLHSERGETSLVKMIKEPKIELRPTTKGDLKWLAPFYEKLMRPIFELCYVWDDGKFQEAFAREAGMIISCGGQDIGFFKVEDRPECIYLGDIQIDPAYQKRGIGTQLIEELKSRAASEKRIIRLRVLKQNPARVFYERLGFRAFNELDHYFEMEWCPLTADSVMPCGEPESPLR